MDQHKLALLSDRGRHFVGNPNMIYQHSSKIRDNLYNPENNPEGVVNMGVAENFLCEDLLIKRFNSPDMNDVTQDMLHYFKFEGTTMFKNSLCKFLTRYFKAAKPLDPNKLIVLSGIGPALDLLANFLADPGDSFLCPAPNYAGIMSDFNGRPQVKILPVHLPLDGIDENLSQERIGEMIEIFEKVYTSEKNKIKGIVLVNPDNPTGHMKPLSLLSAILKFAKRYDLHVICDEAYGLTVFDPDTAVTSLFQMSDIPDRQRTFVLWGFSKDFCMSGIRCGVIYTENEAILQACQQFAYFSTVPPIVQKKLQIVVSDDDWVDMFFKTNISRIRESFAYSRKTLQELAIPFKEPKAAFFIWADFTEFLPELSEAGEMEFFTKLIDHKVFFLPGCVQNSSLYGWFRITIVLPLEILQQGFTNLAKLIGEIRKPKC